MKAIRDPLHLSHWENFKEADTRIGLHFCDLATFKSSTNTCNFVYNTVYNLHEEGYFEDDKESLWQLQF